MSETKKLLKCHPSSECSDFYLIDDIFATKKLKTLTKQHLTL